MSGLLKMLRVQLGLSPTPSQNFTLRNMLDGTLRLSRGNSGAEIVDVLTAQADNTLLAGAHPTTGARSLALATMQKFADEFGVLLTANGYQKLPSGLIIQWGFATSSASAAATVTFPMAFPNLCAAVAFGAIYGSGGLMNAQLEASPTPVSFSYGQFTTAGRSAQGARWIAIGY